MGTLFRFEIRTFLTSGPPLLTSGPRQGSVVPLVFAAAVGDVSVDKVGKGMGVGEGSRVGLGTGVGGMGVAVGMAAIVNATIVSASAMADACTCAGSTVGTVFGAQAASNSASVATMNKTCFIYFLSPKFYVTYSANQKGERLALAFFW